MTQDRQKAPSTTPETVVTPMPDATLVTPLPGEPGGSSLVTPRPGEPAPTEADQVRVAVEVDPTRKGDDPERDGPA